MRALFEGMVPGALSSSGAVPPAKLAGVALACARARKRYASKTDKERRSAWQLFQQYLQSHPAAQGVTPLSAAPEDVVSFMELAYVPHHGRTQMTSGEVVPSFSSVKNILGGLRKSFDFLGRSGPWTERTREGNPCQSLLVEDWRKGYHSELLDDGVEPVAATPMRAEEVHQLLEGLDGELAGLTETGLPSCPFLRMEAYLLGRDALYFSYLWMSSQRGLEAGRLKIADIREEGGRISVRARRTKSRRLEPPSLVPLEPLPPDQNRFCFLARLPRFLQLCRDLGSPVEGFLFRTLGSDRKTVGSLPLTSSAGLGRLKSALGRMGMEPSLTLHSTRRGRMLYDQEQGENPEVTMSRALIKTTAVFRGYLDQTRPDRKRMKTGRDS